MALRVLTALLAVVCAACGPGPQDIPDRVEANVRVSGTPSASGWFRRPVRVTASAGSPVGLLAICFWIVPTRPGGTSVSSARLPCADAQARRTWSSTRRLDAEARHVVQLSVTDRGGKRAAAPDTLVSIDTTPPVTRVDPPKPAVGGHVTLTGTARDASSGVRAVTLVFADGSQRLEFPATCTCSSEARVSRPPEAWRFEHDLPPGLWSVSVTASDHAGWEETPGEPLRIEVR